MTADQFLEKTVQKRLRGDAHVIVMPAKKMGVGYRLKGDQEIPDDNDEQTIYIRIPGIT